MPRQKKQQVIADDADLPMTEEEFAEEQQAFDQEIGEVVDMYRRARANGDDERARPLYEYWKLLRARERVFQATQHGRVALAKALDRF